MELFFQMHLNADTRRCLSEPDCSPLCPGQQEPTVACSEVNLLRDEGWWYGQAFIHQSQHWHLSATGM